MSESDTESGKWFELIDADAVRLDDSVYVEREGLRLLVHHLADGYFVTSSQCLGCHDAGSTGLQFDMTKPNPHGDNEEGWNRGRYGAYHDLDAWRRYLTAAGFAELAHYYRPAGRPRNQQPWLASVWRKADERAPSSNV